MERAQFGSFVNYKQTVIDLIGDLEKLLELSNRMGLSGNAGAIEGVLQRLREDTFSVAIIGEFKRGKSTLINALLGKDVLPMDVLPTTATLNKITYSVTPFVTIEYKNGDKETIEINKLSDYVTKLTKESEERAKTIQEATVYYPVNYCKNGVTIIDTPGLNDDRSMTEVTLSVLPQIDAALMVVMAQAPFSESERQFLESKVITSDLGRVLFVVTGIDLLDEEDVERVLQNITRRIEEHVIAKAQKTFGADSKEFELYKRKIGKVRLYGLSAKRALRAKLKGDDRMLQESCFPAFEQALETFLTEDRGAVMLNVPVNRIKNACLELAKAVQLRESTLSMQLKEFEEKYGHAMEEIDEIRSARRQEFARINENSERTYRELIPVIQNYWGSLEDAAMAAIDRCELTAEDMKKDQIESAKERMTLAARDALTAESQNQLERIQLGIEAALSDEAERLSGFEQHFFSSTEHIQSLFVPKVNGGEDNDVVVGTVVNYLGGFGIGNMYLGYKQAGWKGALLGGATGIAGMAGTGVGVALLTAALAIPLTWPVMLISGIAAAITGTFTGRWAVDKIFPRTDKFKESFKQSIAGELDRMRGESDFGTSVRAQVDAAFDALKHKLKEETELILGDTQNQLTQLKVERARQEIQSEQERTELKELLETVNKSSERTSALSAQLAAVLSR